MPFYTEAELIDQEVRSLLSSLPAGSRFDRSVAYLRANCRLHEQQSFRIAAHWAELERADGRRAWEFRNGFEDRSSLQAALASDGQSRVRLNQMKTPILARWPGWQGDLLGSREYTPESFSFGLLEKLVTLSKACGLDEAEASLSRQIRIRLQTAGRAKYLNLMPGDVAAVIEGLKQSRAPRQLPPRPANNAPDRASSSFVSNPSRYPAGESSSQSVERARGLGSNGERPQSLSGFDFNSPAAGSSSLVFAGMQPPQQQQMLPPPPPPPPQSPPLAASRPKRAAKSRFNSFSGLAPPPRPQMRASKGKKPRTNQQDQDLVNGGEEEDDEDDEIEVEEEKEEEEVAQLCALIERLHAKRLGAFQHATNDEEKAEAMRQMEACDEAMKAIYTL